MTVYNDGTYLHFSDGSTLSTANIAWSQISGQPGLSSFSNNINALNGPGGIGAGQTGGGNCGNIGYGLRVNTYQSGQYVYMQWYTYYNCYNCNCNCNCGKIICTKLYQLGLLEKSVFEADQAFGARLIKERPDIYNGYRAWAEIVVDWMEGKGPNILPWLSKERAHKILQTWAINWAHDIATPWAEEMAYLMGKKESGSLTGKMLTAAGLPICKLVGLWQRHLGPSKKPTGFIKGISLVAVFVMFKAVVELGRTLEKVKEFKYA
jgi:hypothetical protein